MGQTMPTSCCKTIAKPMHASPERRRDARDEASRRQGGHFPVDRFPTTSGRARGSGAKHPQLVRCGHLGRATAGGRIGIGERQRHPSDRAGQRVADLGELASCVQAGRPSVLLMQLAGDAVTSDCLRSVTEVWSIAPGVAVAAASVMSEVFNVLTARRRPSRRGAVGGVSAPRAGPTAWFVESCIGSCRRGRRRSRSRLACRAPRPGPGR